MKKIALICLSVIFITTGASAQMRWGVKAGANMSKLSVEEKSRTIEGMELGWGFHGGLVMEYAFGKSGFAIQPELLYIQNNSSHEYTIDGTREQDEFSFNQLQLPINAKYSFGTDNFKLFVLGGPYLSYSLSGKSKSAGEDDFDYFKKYGDKDASLKRFDMGLGIGIGVEFSKFTFTIGDQFGLLDTANDIDSSVKANNVVFSVGYFF